MAPDNAAEDWRMLGKWLEHARGTCSKLHVEAVTGVRSETIRGWEAGENKKASSALANLVDFYGWPPGSVDRALAGEAIPLDLPRCSKRKSVRVAEVPPSEFSEAELQEARRKVFDGDGELTAREAALLHRHVEDRTRRTV